MLDESKLEPGVNHIRITAKGEGRLYYAARGEYYSTEKKLEKTGTTSLNLLRDYYRLKPGRVNDRIVYDTVPLEGPVAAGDVLAVRLTVTGTDWPIEVTAPKPVTTTRRLAVVSEDKSLILSRGLCEPAPCRNDASDLGPTSGFGDGLAARCDHALHALDD